MQDLHQDRLTIYRLSCGEKATTSRLYHEAEFEPDRLTGFIRVPALACSESNLFTHSAS